MMIPEHIAFTLHLQTMNGANFFFKKLGQLKQPLTVMHAVALSLTNVAIRQVIPLLYKNV